MTSIHRGDIWLANLDRTVGSEIQKTRPCVVLSPEEMGYLQTVMVAPMTTVKPRPFTPSIKVKYVLSSRAILTL